MRKLQVYIEIEGMQTYVGSISGSSPDDAQFAYSDQYIAAGHPPISISLPVLGEPFSAEATKNFFEGLLPEGFARKCVVNWIHYKVYSTGGRKVKEQEMLKDHEQELAENVLCV